MKKLLLTALVVQFVVLNILNAQVSICDELHVCTEAQTTIQLCPNYCQIGSDYSVDEYYSQYNCSIVIPPNPPGCVLYTPLPGMEFVGQDSIAITACNPSGACSTMVYHIQIGGCNYDEPPVAVDDYEFAIPGDPTQLNVIENDIIPDGTETTICTFEQPNNGTIVQNNDGFEYTSDADFCGVDSFIYSLCNDAGQSTATVTIDVSSNNNSPIVNNENATSLNGAAISVDVLSNDFDPNGDAISICEISYNGNGVVSILNDEIIYTPEVGFEGFETILYMVCDDHECSLSNTGLLHIEAIQEDDCDEGPFDLCTMPVTMITICPDFCDINNAIIDTANSLYHCSIVEEEFCINYTPLPGFPIGYVDEVSIIGCDDYGNCQTIIYYITILENCDDVQYHPVALNDNGTSINGESVYINALFNDYDPDSDSITITDFSQPEHGIITLLNGEFVYTPNDSYEGTDFFDYIICDDDGLCDSATVIITVTQEEDCQDVFYLCVEPIQPILLCPEFCDISNADSFVYHTSYNCSVHPVEPCYEYTPLPGLPIGITDSVSIIGCNTFTNQCDTIIYYITLLENCSTSEIPPIALNDTTYTDENTPVNIFVLGNDFDPEGQTITITGNTNASNGTVTFNGSYFTYVPNDGFVGEDSFNYTICDTDGLCDTATVVIFIEDTCQDVIYLCTTPITPTTLCPEFCVVNYVDSLSATHTYNCSIQVNDGCVIYTPLPGVPLGNMDSIYVTGCNTITEECETILYIVTLLADCTLCQGPPVAVDDATISDGNPVLIHVTTNDFDPNGDSFSVCANTFPTYGNLVQNGNTFIYTPDPGFEGCDEFTYAICEDYTNGDCQSNFATVTVCVDDTYCNNLQENYCIHPETTLDICPDFCAFDENYEITEIQVATNGLNVINLSNGECIRVSPLNGFLGQENVVVTACTEIEGEQFCNTVNLFITVSTECDENIPPVACPDAYTIANCNLDAFPLFIIDECDYDPNNDDFFIYSWTDPSLGAITLSEDGTYFNYFPESVETFYSTTFEYTLQDELGAVSNTVTVSITMNCVLSNITVNDDYYVITEGQEITIDAIENDELNQDCEYELSIINNPFGGTAFINSDMTITFIPNDDFTGQTIIEYEITGCGSKSSAFIVIKVEDLDMTCELFIPNAFSPNNDGVNDEFVIPDLQECYTKWDSEIILFNRWGKIIEKFTSLKDLTYIWSGKTSEGNIAPSGTYFYVLTLIKDNSEIREFGFIELRR